MRQKIQARLGGKLKYFISGGAALNPEIGSFFMALGVKLLQGYGQTEASPVISANRPGKIKIETVGPPVAGVEVRFADDGEILVRGDLLMKGYWRDDHSTAATIRDGWLYTGDIGSCDDDGYITITGRKKEIIVNSGGENIVPSRVEALLTIEPEIEQALVDGDRRPWLAAVIVPSAEARATAASDEALKLLIAETVERANSRLSQIERVRRFIIADEGFTTENSQLTATLKVRRHIVKGAISRQACRPLHARQAGLNHPHYAEIKFASRHSWLAVYDGLIAVLPPVYFTHVELRFGPKSSRINWLKASAKLRFASRFFLRTASSGITISPSLRSRGGS